MKYLALLLCVGLVAGDLDNQWRLYKAKMGKKYSDSEDSARRAIWESTVAAIQKHNLEADMGLHTYTMGINQFSDWTDHEYLQLLGFNSSMKRLPSSHYVPASHVKLPDEVDWRKEGYVTPVKNQGSCGSCWAFSATGSLEGQHFKKSGTLVSLSEQNLVDCSTKEGNHGCGGGLMDYAFKYVEDNKGIDTEKSYPYEGRQEKCHYDGSSIGATCTGFVDVTKDSEKDLMSAVANVGPISVAIDASHPSFRSYKSGVYTEPRCSSTRLDHGVLAIGYGVEGDTAYWLVKNSWGTTWGDKGFIKMRKDDHNMCGIATMSSYPLV